MRTLSVVASDRVFGEDYLAGTTVQVTDDEKAAALLAYQRQIGGSMVHPFVAADGASAGGESDDGGAAVAGAIGPAGGATVDPSLPYIELVAAARAKGLTIAPNTRKADVIAAILAAETQTAQTQAGQGNSETGADV